MGTSRSAPNDWMTKNGNGKMADNVFAGAGGWYVTHPNGQVELLHGMSNVAESPVNAPDMMSVSNPAPGDYSVLAGDKVAFTIMWTEPVVVTGTPQITFEEDGVEVQADYVAGSSTSTKSVFEFEVTTEGVIDTVTITLGLNSGTIVGADVAVAALTPVFADDTVDSVTVNSGGSGYAETETITFDAPNNSLVVATVDVVQAGGVIQSVTLVNPGYGYESGVVAVAGGTSGTVTIVAGADGVITSAVVNAGGTGYSDGVANLAAASLTITTATADLTFVDNAITEVTMTEVGYGYDGNEGYTLSAEPAGTAAVLDFPADYAQPTGVVVVA